MTRFTTAAKNFGYFDNDELLDRIGNGIFNEYIGKIECFLSANGSINNCSKHNEITPRIKVNCPMSTAFKTYNQNRMPISITPRLVSNVRKHTQIPSSNSGLCFCLPKDDQLSTKRVKHISENFLRVG